MEKKNIDKVLGIKCKLIEKFKVGEEVANELVEDYGCDVINITEQKLYILCHYKIDFDVVKRIIVTNSSNKCEMDKNISVVAATIIHVNEYLNQFEGHTFIYKSELMHNLNVLLVEEMAKEVLEKAIELLEIDCEIVTVRDNQGRECIYLSRLYNAEVEMANLIAYFVEENRRYNCDTIKVAEFINAYDSVDIKLNYLQQEAVKMALTNRISIISGVAGGGKTTTIKAIVDGFKHLKKNNIQLTSFTGKAVERISAITGMQGSTIHRLLGIGVKDSNKVFSVKADVIILDEAGTVGLELFRCYLQA